jgi:hypothetical protein
VFAILSMEMPMQTSPSDFELLAIRVDRLERQIRRLKRGALAGLLAVASLIAMGQARPNTGVEAQRFTLRDAKGAKRAELVLDSETPQSSPNPTLRFFDEKGNGTLTLSPTKLELAGQSALGSNILLDDAKGVARADIGLLDEQSFVLLNDANGLARVRMDLDHDQPRIALLGIAPSQNPMEIPLLALGMINGEPSLSLYDTNGTSAAIGATKVIANGKERQAAAASIILFDKDGSILWAAPNPNP